MIKVGGFEAKAHLSALLDKVKHGEEVLITKREKAIRVLFLLIKLTSQKWD